MSSILRFFFNIDRGFAPLILLRFLLGASSSETEILAFNFEIVSFSLSATATFRISSCQKRICYSRVSHIKNHFLTTKDTPFLRKQWIKQQAIVLKQQAESKKAVSYMRDSTVLDKFFIS